MTAPKERPLNKEQFQYAKNRLDSAARDEHAKIIKATTITLPPVSLADIVGDILTGKIKVRKLDKTATYTTTSFHGMPLHHVFDFEPPAKTKVDEKLRAQLLAEHATKWTTIMDTFMMGDAPTIRQLVAEYAPA